MLKYGRKSNIETRGRIDMPQVKSEHFEEFLKWSNIDVKHVKMNLEGLMPTQSEFNDNKIKEIVVRIIAEDPTFKGKIIVSKDGYVLDGHHRWLAMINASKPIGDCYVLDVDYKTALGKMKEFPKSIRQGI